MRSYPFSLPLITLMLVMLSGCSTGLFSSDETVEKVVVTSSSRVSVVWSANIDQRRPGAQAGMSRPAAVQGSTGELIIAGAQDKRVRILDAASGSERFRIAMTAAGESGAVQLANGLVVIGDVDGNLFGIDVNQGTIAWQKQLSSPLLSRPVPVGNGFIIQTVSNQVFRFTAAGEKIWSFSGPIGGLGMQLMPSPVLYRGHLYIAMRNGDVVALKAANGSFLWQRQLLISSNAAVLSEMKVPAATPVIIPAEQSGRSEDMLAVPLFQGEIFFLSLLDGSTLISRSISLKASPLLIGNEMFVADTTGAVSKLSVAGGETLWKEQIASSELAGPTLWNNTLWVVSESGKVSRLSLDGKLLASIELDGRFDLAPVATTDGVLVRNNLGTLFKLR